MLIYLNGIIYSQIKMLSGFHSYRNVYSCSAVQRPLVAWFDTVPHIVIFLTIMAIFTSPKPSDVDMLKKKVGSIFQHFPQTYFCNFLQVKVVGYSASSCSLFLNTSAAFQAAYTVK